MLIRVNLMACANVHGVISMHICVLHLQFKHVVDCFGVSVCVCVCVSDLYHLNGEVSETQGIHCRCKTPPKTANIPRAKIIVMHVRRHSLRWKNYGNKKMESFCATQHELNQTLTNAIHTYPSVEI